MPLGVAAPCVQARKELKKRLVKIKGPREYRPEGSTRYFIPERDVEDVLSSKLLKRVLTCSCENCSEYRRVTGFHEGPPPLTSPSYLENLRQYKRTIALLVWIKRAGLICTFIDHRIDLSTVLGPGSLGFLDTQEFLADDLELEDTKEEIVDKQYMYRRVQEIPGGSALVEVDEHRAIAFTYHDEKPLAKGGYGEVYRVKIHPDSLGAGFSKDKNLFYARKVFKNESAKNDWMTEWKQLEELLQRMGQEKQQIIQHLMLPLAAFSHGKCYSILLPCADASLQDLLDGTDLAKNMTFTSREFWTQMNGLASALAYIQNHASGICYHLDLKPANILIQGGVFKITDFGVAQWKDKCAQLSSPNPSKTDSGIPIWFLPVIAYAPPEALKLPNTDATTINRGFDVWSLGCMFTEGVVFMLKGSDGVKVYRNARLAETSLADPAHPSPSFHKDGEVKRCVLETCGGLMKSSKLPAISSALANGTVSLDEWEENFYGDTLFQLIRKMLAQEPVIDGEFKRRENRAGILPLRCRAKEVTKTLTSLLEHANEASDFIIDFTDEKPDLCLLSFSESYDKHKADDQPPCLDAVSDEDLEVLHDAFPRQTSENGSHQKSHASIPWSMRLFSRKKVP